MARICLGDDGLRLDGVGRAFGQHAFQIRVVLEDVDVFPNAGILYTQAKPSPALLSFAEQVFRAMETGGFSREPRPYTPHITLARSKGRVHLNGHEQSNSAFHQRFEAHEFRLYESFTLPGGAQYEVLRAFSLV